MLFLSIQSSYKELEVSLFFANKLVDSVLNTKENASSYLISVIDSVLVKNMLKLSDLSFIAINKGPGAFISLRVAIATINGIYAATKIPLIGVSGLEALAREIFDSSSKVDFLISLLNAYNNDVYYLFSRVNNSGLFFLNKGYCKINKIVKLLENKDFYKKKIIFAGNGFLLHKDRFLSNNNYTYSSTLVPSAKFIGILAYESWLKNKENFKKPIVPMYIKTQKFSQNL
jgi:tRNA threonylcarbamoyladenosine biosynthesis protein TsaB